MIALIMSDNHRNNFAPIRSITGPQRSPAINLDKPRENKTAPIKKPDCKTSAIYQAITTLYMTSPKFERNVAIQNFVAFKMITLRKIETRHVMHL